MDFIAREPPKDYLARSPTPKGDPSSIFGPLGSGTIKRKEAPSGPGVFISYRHDDEPWYARNLHTKLASKFDKERVFLDVDNIDLGVDFAAAIDEELSKCVVLVVVIGKGWLSAADPSGMRRLDDPDDFVRLEIESGLARSIVVIPVLVDGASMPRAVDLPESLRPLARRKGQDMSYARFGSDCQQLISTIERILGTPNKAQAKASDAGAPSAKSPQDSETPQVYSSNEFNVAVTTEMRQIWWNRFNEKVHMELRLDNTKEPNGGFDGMIWPLDNPDAKIAVKTFPSPNERLGSSVALEGLKGKDTPCLIVTRLPLNEWTRSAIEQSYPPPVQFLHWTGSDEDKEALERSLRILREALN
jgi:hypothetical protein